MQQPVRATAEVLGLTVFSSRHAVLEWSPDNRFRIVTMDPGSPPEVLFDGPPQAMRRVSHTLFGQDFVSFVPQQGRRIRVSLTGSELPPEPGESAEHYRWRVQSTPVPPSSWWVDMFRAGGVQVRVLGWGFLWLALLGVVAGVAITVGAVLLS